MSNSSASILKIFRPAEWEALCTNGSTPGSPLDMADGFIHFSTPDQTASTLALHFMGAGDLVLAEIPMSALEGHDLRWEAARDGSLFPHLYGTLRRADVSRHWVLHPDANGGYALPDFD